MAKVRLFYRRKICYWLIVSVMILMTLNPSLQVIAKESVSDDLTVYTDAGESLELYARSAVLMDGDSGRILFEKNGSDPRPMASTTKIMTCILALEASDPSRKITVSSQAASQPKVHLGMTEGQSFYLKDLLYSLMLESHNDAAVAIAEGIDGSVEAFAQRMNQKAEEIGCKNTYFISPNGLDAQDSQSNHHTTARELALILRYCIMISPQREAFLKITRTMQYTFQDCEKNFSYSCNNHNAFLNMMEGALTGKTGFTADAGYCYVGALQRDDRTFIVALLACDWPNNRNYKWMDTKKLMTYGLENYVYRDFQVKAAPHFVLVQNGIENKMNYPSSDPVRLEVRANTEPFRLLMNQKEDISIRYYLTDKVHAPVRENTRLGIMKCYLGDEVIREFPLVATKTIAKRTLKTCFDYAILKYINETD